MTCIVPIVEGHGEVRAVPALLHRIAQRAKPGIVLKVQPPIRVKAGSFLNDPPYFAKMVQLAAAKAAQASGHVLILLDCDDGCPAILGPKISRQASAVRTDASFLVCLALREYETWFMAAADSLRGRIGLPHDLGRPSSLESTRDAKGWLSSRMPWPYEPTLHQLDMTKLFDLQQAADASASFARLVARVEAILRQ